MHMFIHIHNYALTLYYDVRYTQMISRRVCKLVEHLPTYVRRSVSNK